MTVAARPRFLLAVLLLALLLNPFPASASVFYPTSFTLANGLQIIVVPNHLAPVVTQMVWYKVGSSYETPGKTGLAHYLEHLMFRGTDNMGPGEFSRAIAAQGGEENAFTSYDYTAFHETVAVDRLPMIMSMEADRMQNLHITPETATPELSVVLDERQQRTDNDPHGRFNEKTRHLLLPHYPYGVPVIGWKSEIEKLDANDARQFYQHHYAPNNAIVVISGDVTPETVMRLAAGIYGAVPQHDVERPRPLRASPLPKKQEFSMTDIGVEEAQVQLEVVVPSRRTQKAHETYAYEVLDEALDSGEVGVLYRDLALQKNLASGIDVDYDPDARGDAIFTIAATPRPGVDAKQLRDGLAAELAAIAATGLDPKTVDDAKARLKRAAIFARDSLMVPGYAFGTALATGSSVADVEEWPQRIDAVTVDDVNAALRDLAANPKHLMSSLLPDRHATQAQREAAQPVISHNSSIR